MKPVQSGLFMQLLASTTHSTPVAQLAQLLQSPWLSQVLPLELVELVELLELLELELLELVLVDEVVVHPPMPLLLPISGSGT
jgi:hypothetical protein